MTHRLRAIPIFISLFILLTVCSPNLAWGWGAGVHGVLTVHGYERISHRWKDAFNLGLLIHGSYGPDVWYILSDDFMASFCTVSCGKDNGKISNECWGHYTNPDRTFAWSRHLVANARDIPEISWAFGYAAHAVEDWRGHMEYIIPDWVNPSGSLFNRHTFIDSAGAALVFNVHGLHGYPTDILAHPMLYGYENTGFLSTENAETMFGNRNPKLGYAVDLERYSDGTMHIDWKGVIDEATTGMNPESMLQMTDAASLGSSSEGILASLYGVTEYDNLGHGYPIVVENGESAIDCSTNYRQRMTGKEGAGGSLPCQASMGVVSGLAQWTSYIKPTGKDGDIVPDLQTIEKWMDYIAVEYENGGVRLDDRAVFGIDPETGLSTKHLHGVDDRDFTYGRSMPEIVSEVLEFSVQDLVDRLFENPHMIGTVLQSGANPFEKARFVEFGASYRPRMSAWTETMEYENETVILHPAAPGPFARVDFPIDLRSATDNPAPEMIFPYYRLDVALETADFHGTGLLDVETAVVDEDGIADGEIRTATLDLATMQWQASDETVSTPQTDETTTRFSVFVENSSRNEYFATDAPARAFMISLILNVSDEAQPPLDLQIDATLQGFCEKPDGDTTAPTDNADCPPVAPENEDGSEGDSDTEGKTSSSSSGGCRTNGAFHNASLAFLLAWVLSSRRRRHIATFCK